MEKRLRVRDLKYKTQLWKKYAPHSSCDLSSEGWPCHVKAHLVQTTSTDKSQNKSGSSSAIAWLNPETPDTSQDTSSFHLFHSALSHLFYPSTYWINLPLVHLQSWDSCNSSTSNPDITTTGDCWFTHLFLLARTLSSSSLPGDC